MKPAIELIDWHDHWSKNNPGWKDSDEILDMMKTEFPQGVRIRSIGHLVGETKNSVCLAGTMDENGTISGEIIILKKTIFNRQVLRKAKK